MRKRKLSKDRIETILPKEKKQKRVSSSAIIVGVIIFIMVFSSIAIGFFYNPGSDISENSVEYGGFTFTDRGNGWFVDINGNEYGFEYGPFFVENVKSIDLKNEEFSNRVYVAFDPSEFSENSDEIFRLRQFLQSRGIAANPACIKEEGCGDLPIVSCDNQDVIYLDSGENTQIYKDKECIVLESKPGEELQAINRFMYGVLGVM